MAKCDQCFEMLPPNFCRPIEVKGQEKDDNICLFCDLDKKEMEITTDGRKTTYTKKQAIADYKKFLNFMKEKVAKLGDIKAARDVADSGLILPGTPEFNEAMKGN